MKNLLRRTFLQNLAIGVGGATAVVALPVLKNDAMVAPKFSGKKLNIALCGLGRYAGYLAEG